MATARTPEGNNRVRREHRASLPTTMPMQAEGQDGGATAVADRAASSPSMCDKLDMVERKEVFIVLENDTAFFECKIDTDLNPMCTWYRNGIRITEDHRTSITNDGEMQLLKITGVQICDHGLYVLECRYLNQQVTVNHQLYVAPREINDCVFHRNQKYFKMGVRKHLTNTRVYKGDTIEMVAMFIYEADKYFWFKNNQELRNDNRITITKCTTRAYLSIKDATATDTGIYYVLALSTYGFFSSFADVIVLKSNAKIPLLPIIEEHPPEDVEGYIGEEIRVCAKVQTDANTMIKWDRNASIIVTDKVKQIDFGNNYIGLLIPSPKILSAGEYQLLMANSQIPQVVRSSVRVSIIEPPPPLEKDIKVVRKLESAVACCGAQVSFDCSFELQDPLYFYVVWYVGHYKVERSNSLFRVVCGQGEFLLYINRFEPSMAGEVICELRRAYPNKASIRVQRAFASLTCVPPCVIQESETDLISKLVLSPVVDPLDRNEFEENRTRLQHMQALAVSWKERLLKFCASGLNLGCGLPRTVTAAHFVQQDEDGEPVDDFILQIVFCKLDNEGLYFMSSTIYGQDRERVTRITAHEVSTDDFKSTVIEWNDTGGDAEICYRLEIGLAGGTFAKAGITLKPYFVIHSVPIDRMFVFRICGTRPPRHVDSSEISIIPPPESVLTLSALQHIQSEYDFEKTYFRTDYNIGAGAFGCVTLVQNKKDLSEYAAKIVKARTGKKRLNVFREFHIMKNLSHPKIIRLVGFYEMPYSYIFVMEYCWGGELFDRVAAEECMREMDVVLYVRQICEALQYLNEVGIVHLDIKPENIICISPNSTQVKIIDFGLARSVNESNPRTIYGTKEYMAPEILDYEPISTFSDMWSVGVVTYVLLSGLMPFAGNNWYERSFNISSVFYDYDDDAFDEVSDLAKEFVDQLLVHRPDHRLSAAEALNHSWLRDGPPKRAGSKQMHKMRKNMKSYLVEFKRHWHRARNVVIAAHRLRMLAHPKT